MSNREIPYSPMGKRREVSFERMQEILSKHRGVVSNAPAEILPPSNTSIRRSSLGWRPKEVGDGERSDTIEAEGYCVLTCTADGARTGRYLAFFKGKSRGFDSEQEAKDYCERHYAGRMEKKP